VRKAYRIVALLIAAEAVVQSVALGYFVGALNRWIATEGAVGVADHSALRALPGEGKVVALDRMVLASAEQWLAGGVGLTIHTITELWVAPALAVLLVAVGFRDSRATALPVAGAVALQWLSGLVGTSAPAAAAVHELAVFAVFVTALWAAGMVRWPVGNVFRGLGGLIAVALLVQAMALAAVVAGIAGYVNDGHAEVYDSMLSNPDEWADGGFGYPVHVVTGIAVLPVLALLLMVGAPFTAGRAGAWRAGIVLLAVLARGVFTLLGEVSAGAAAGFQLVGFAVLAALIVSRSSSSVPALAATDT
jgi:hypothetical protein